MKRNDYVYLGKNSRVYRIWASYMNHEGEWFYLEANAEHPDAAKRVPDDFRWYRESELRLVTDG